MLEALLLRHLASLMATIGIGLAAGAPFALGGSAALETLRSLGAPMFSMLAGLSIISGVAKAGKLQILLVRLGYRLPFFRTTAISLVTDLAFLSSPAGAAGYVVNVALLRNAGTSLSVSTAVVGAEQALDFVFFAVAIPLATLSALVPLASLLPAVSRSTCLVVLLAVLLSGVALWWSRNFLLGALNTFVGAIPWFRARQDRLDHFVAELREQIHAIVNGPARQNIALLVLTVLQWVARYGVLWLVLREFGCNLPFGFVLVLQAVVLHLAQWTGVPAGGGSADLGLAAVLAAWATMPTIASVLILWRFSTLYFPLLLGALGFVVLTCTRRTNRTIAYETQS